MNQVTISITGVNRDGVQALVEHDWLQLAIHSSSSSWHYDVTLRPLSPDQVQQAVKMCLVPHVPRKPRTTT